jgi:hypothetical protein
MPFHRPEKQEWVIFERVVTENTNQRRIQSATRERRDTAKECSAWPYEVVDPTTQGSVKSSRTPVRISNPGERKQIYRNLVAIFGRVRQK